MTSLESIEAWHAAKDVDNLTGALRHDDGEVRACAAEALMDLALSDELAAMPHETLMAALGDPVSAVRLAALSIAGALRLVAALESVKQLVNDHDPTVCANALYTWRDLGGEGIEPAARLHTAHEAFEVRAAAAEILARLAMPAGYELYDPAGEPSVHAIAALAQTRDPHVVPFLQLWRGHRSTTVREATAAALAHLGGPPPTVPGARDRQLRN